MTTILVARPEAEGRQTASRLQAKGYETILTPALEIAPVEAVMPAGTFQAAMVSSLHAAPWLAAQKDVPKSLPVFAVGARTAAALREAGFTDVRTASGDRVALAALVRGAVPKDSALLMPVGRDHHGDVPDGLRAEGYRVETPVVYAANFAGSLTPEALAALRYDVADAVLHYSARSASGFVTLLSRAEIDPAALHLRHICLSQQVADALPADLRAHAVVAAQADEDSMLKAVEDVFAAGGTTSDSRSQKSRKARPRAFAIDAKATEVKIEKPAQDAVAAASSVRPGEEGRSAVPVSSHSEATKVMSTTPAEPAIAAAPAAEPVPPPKSGTETSNGGQVRYGPTGAGKPAESANAPALRPRRMGLPLLGAGLLGGMIGGAAALFLPPYLPKGWLPGSKAPDVAGLVAAQVKADLDARTASLPSRTDVDALKQAMANAAVQQNQSSAALQNAVGDVSRKLAEVERLARTAPDQAAAAQKQLAELAKRVDLLDGVAKVPYDIVGLSKRVDDIAARKPEPVPDLAPVDKQLAAANAAIADLRSKLDALAAKPIPDTGRPVRIHALATGVMSALQRGAPYRPELDAVSAAGVPLVTIQPLQPFADKGAPTGAAMAKSFEVVAPKILQALQPPSAPNPGFWERLKDMTGNMVRVRPVGQNAADTPAGQVGRIEAALPRGAFADALRAWQALPQAGQAASADFGAALKARADADAAARAFVDEATRALARQGQ